MNDETYHSDSLEELSGDLRVAIEHLKHRPVPEGAMQRALDRATRCGSPIPGALHQFRFKAVLGVIGFVAAAAACIVIGFLFLRPSAVWADVVKAVQAKPWIHGTLRGANPGQSSEFWISTSGASGGSCSEQQISFFDDRLRIIYRYDPPKKILYRLPASTEELAQDQQFLETMQGLFRDDAELKAGFSGVVLKEQKRRETERDGRKWDEYDLHFQIPSRPNGDLNMTFVVDPQTHLPYSMMMKSADGHSAEGSFDYPESGPADIYALGVPKDAKLIDRVPMGDMSRLLAAIQAGRDRFDDFQALVIRNESPDLFPTAGKEIPMAFLVWKKGNHWRVETALPPQEYFGNHFPTDEDHKQWLGDLFKKAFFTTLYVCDGNAVYEGDRNNFKLVATADNPYPANEALNAMPATWCYPETFPSPNDRTEETVNLKPSQGPPNTILVTSRLLDARQDEVPFQRFWLDPARGYAVVSYDLFMTDPAAEPHPTPLSLQLMDQWEQTPGGIWYPTRVGVGSRSKDLKTGATWYHFFLYFKADMPDELFKPAKRTVLTDRYPVGW